jgi:serine phosphatase RsbU (regulator of sigma subunit)
MDVALCRFIKAERLVEYSGAYRPLVLFRDGVMQEIAASRYPIGYYNNVPKKFETTTLQLRSDDMLFMFSDGYADQFGGEREKKLNKRGFRELLQTIHTMKGEEQASFLDYALQNWKQQYAQTDDITVVGVRI